MLRRHGLHTHPLRRSAALVNIAAVTLNSSTAAPSSAQSRALGTGARMSADCRASRCWRPSAVEGLEVEPTPSISNVPAVAASAVLPLSDINENGR